MESRDIEFIENKFQNDSNSISNVDFDLSSRNKRIQVAY
jgi:hypothetical protein